MCFEGPEDQLTLTENTQPAILTMSIAALRLLSSRGLRPDFVAGPAVRPTPARRPLIGRASQVSVEMLRW